MNNFIHIVKKGDTLYSISKQYGVAIENLVKFNDIKNQVIFHWSRIKDPSKKLVMRYQRSSILFKEAQKVIPGGVNSPVRAFKSVGGTPIFYRKSKRCITLR